MRPTPLPGLLSIHAILYDDRGRFTEPGAFLFDLLQHIEHVLRRAIVEAARRSAISLPEFGGGQLLPVHRSGGDIVRLRVVRSPAEISRGNEAGVDNGAELEQEQGDRDQRAQHCLTNTTSVPAGSAGK